MEPEAVNLWVELLKLGIFAVFVTSIIEVIKGISAKGAWGILTDFIGTVLFNKPMCKESIQTLNFAIALLCCWSFDYGVINKLIEPGKHVRIGLSGWIDYFGTASLVYAGADTLFKKFASMRDAWKTAKDGRTSVTSSITQTDSSITTQTDSKGPEKKEEKKGD